MIVRRIVPAARDELTNHKRNFVVVAIFGVVSVIFCIYERCVERRQQVVLLSSRTFASNVSLLEQKVLSRTQKLEKSNEELAFANMNIKQASAAQLQHFACMSHEIRTPQNCIIGCSSLLEEAELEPSHWESVGMIVSSGNLLLSVVNDVLDFSRLESGNVDIEIKPTNLQKCLSTVVHAISVKADTHDLTVETKYDVEVPSSMHTDVCRLQQILFNLLGNAVKFSKERGTIEFSIDVVDHQNCNSSLSYAPPVDTTNQSGEEAFRFLRFVVKDYGKGINRSDYERFSNLFSKTMPTQKLFAGGLG